MLNRFLYIYTHIYVCMYVFMCSLDFCPACPNLHWKSPACVHFLVNEIVLRGWHACRWQREICCEPTWIWKYYHKRKHTGGKMHVIPLRCVQGQLSLFKEKPSVWWYIDSGSNERLPGGVAASPLSLLCLKGRCELCPVHADSAHWDVVLSQLGDRRWGHTLWNVTCVCCTGLYMCKNSHNMQ